MREERTLIVGFHDFGSLRKGSFGIPILAAGGICFFIQRFAHGGKLGCRAFRGTGHGPLEHERIAPFFRFPGRIGEHGHFIPEADDLLHTGHSFGSRVIHRFQFHAERGWAGDDRYGHPFPYDIGAIEFFTGKNIPVVHIGNALAEQAERGTGLERYLFGRFERCGFCGQFAIRQATTGRRMHHGAFFRRTTRRLYPPALGRCFYQQVACGGPCRAQACPGSLDGAAPSCYLAREVDRIQRCLANDYARPVGIQLFCHDHGHGRFDPLAYFRIGGYNRNGPIRCDLDIRIHRNRLDQFPVGSGPQLLGEPVDAHEYAAACDSRYLDKRATIKR